MKHGYEGVIDGQVISHFKEKGDKIIINFLDDSYYELPLSEDNKGKLMELMLLQAEERNNSSALANAKAKRKKAIKWLIVEAVCGVITSAGMLTAENKTHGIIAGVLTMLSGVGIIVNGIRYQINNDEIKELQKYAIYLTIREQVEACTDSNLFNEVNSKVRVLNINTLDCFSLADIKKIQGNLGRIQKLNPVFNGR